MTSLDESFPNCHSNRTAKLKVVNLLIALPRRFMFYSHVFVRSNPKFNDLRELELPKASCDVDGISLRGAGSFLAQPVRSIDHGD